MNKEFIPSEQSLELKELGFNESCLKNWYQANNGFVLVDEITQSFQPHTLAPLYQQAFRWFRENYGYNGVIEGSRRFGFEWCIYRDEWEYIKPPNNSNTYEEAELDCLKKLIEIVKNK